MPDKVGKPLLSLKFIWPIIGILGLGLAGQAAAEQAEELSEEFLEYLGEYLMENNEWLDPLEVELMASGDSELAPQVSAEAVNPDDAAAEEKR